MRRPATLVLVFGLLAIIFFAAHVYLANRLVLDAAFPPLVDGLLVGAMAFFGVAVLVRIIGRWWLDLPLPAATAWIAYPWIGFIWVLLVLTLATDLVLLVASIFAPGIWAQAATARALVVWGAAIAIGAFGVHSAFRLPAVRRIEVAIGGWPAGLDGFRIVQLSDVHIGPLLRRRFAQRLVDRTNALGADLVAVTGDLVDGRVEELVDEVEPFSRLRARHGVYYVTGNHDYISGGRSWVEHVRRLGMRVLRNEHVTVGDGAGKFDLAGVEDHHAHMFDPTEAEDLERALAGRDRSRPLVLLAHQPNTFSKAAESGVDLQISGHTHGGQIWPFSLLVRLYTPFIGGRYRLGDSQLYVSLGTGFWGPPMRLLAPSEITEFVLRPKAA
ncbi:MAG: uncharacterized protein QOD06_1257 [Candidatus Binatota bacterium]|nr:uncharacterized protein [Candidatus Binatota bacterium]